MTDDESVIAMVDANIQREELLPSERAYAFKMKLEALRHQGTSRHYVGKLGIESAEIVGEGSGLGGRQVQRYIRLTELIPEILEYVDLKRIQFTSAVEISYLDKEIQNKNAVDRRYIFLINTAVQDAVFRISGPNVLIYEEWLV